MKVKQYNRAVLLLKVVYEALQQIKLEAFEEWLLSTHRSKSIEIPWVWRVGKSDWTTKPNEFQRCYWIGYSFVWKISKIWRDTFRPRNYGFIEMAQNLLDFIKSTRNGESYAHLQASEKMLKWYFAYDGTNYSRHFTYYWATQQKFHSTHPDIYHEFLNCHFEVRRTSGTFNMLPSDQV